jgi:hypothetical protein
MWISLFSPLPPPFFWWHCNTNFLRPYWRI